MQTLEIESVDLASLCYLNKERYPFLLESVNHNENNRYSILFAFPGKKIVLDEFSDFNFLSKLENKVQIDEKNINLPFTGGWFAYLSYELIGQIESILLNNLHTSKLPIAYAVKIPCAVIADHQSGTFQIIDQDNDQDRIDRIIKDIEKLKPIPTLPFSRKIITRE